MQGDREQQRQSNETTSAGIEIRSQLLEYSLKRFGVDAQVVQPGYKHKRVRHRHGMEEGGTPHTEGDEANGI